MIGEAASRSSLELPGPPARAAAGRRRDRHAGGAAGDERTARSTCAGRPSTCRRSSTSGTRARRGGDGGRQPALRRRLAGRQAARSPGRARVGQVPMIYSHTRSRTSRRTRRSATGTRRARRCSRSATASATRRFDVRRPGRRPRRDRGRRDRRRCRWTSPTPATAQADEVVQLYIHQRHGTASRPVRELKGFERITLGGRGVAHASTSRSGPASCATGTRPSRDWVVDASTFDVWVGGDSTAQLATTFEVAKG